MGQQGITQVEENVYSAEADVSKTSAAKKNRLISSGV